MTPTVHKYSRFYQRQLLFDFKLSDHFSDYSIGPNKHTVLGVGLQHLVAQFLQSRV